MKKHIVIFTITSLCIVNNRMVTAEKASATSWKSSFHELVDLGKKHKRVTIGLFSTCMALGAFIGHCIDKKEERLKNKETPTQIWNRRIEEGKQKYKQNEAILKQLENEPLSNTEAMIREFFNDKLKIINKNNVTERNPSQNHRTTIDGTLMNPYSNYKFMYEGRTEFDITLIQIYLDNNFTITMDNGNVVNSKSFSCFMAERLSLLVEEPFLKRNDIFSLRSFIVTDDNKFNSMKETSYWKGFRETTKATIEKWRKIRNDN